MTYVRSNRFRRELISLYICVCMSIDAVIDADIFTILSFSVSWERYKTEMLGIQSSSSTDMLVSSSDHCVPCPVKPLLNWCVELWELCGMPGEFRQEGEGLYSVLLYSEFGVERRGR